ncbi:MULTISPECIES: flavin reductase family protein [Mycolicibacterium]|uniref:Flavin reductase like domain protein n=1 Tax=Mycolicibacterium neoaurum TaxID=1795 RepID=A0AAV2WI39_MYCNE|nr:flavin reductase family protein [Mycolicibacterium neoaurum]QVI26273.1 flavin reductase family protein [Mycolicibacterium neoaurum]TLH63356.1 flavin reductase family protein [Mycolicibacterium neoaurum]CDQ43979.1 Flavin reductase like domain protein [Mycolicibacterium neoaurum]
MAGPEAHFYLTAEGTGLPHDPFNAIVGPRPIGWISTVNPEGVRNLAPYSFFNGFNYRPPIIGFSSVGWKDSVANIEATGEFVWNLATRDLAVAMNETSASLPPDEDEFVRAGLTAAPSRTVAAPRVLESPVNFECALTQLIQLRDTAGDPVDTWMVLGQVIAVHIDRQWLVDGVYDTTGPRPILRAGGPANYSEAGPDGVFTMQRPN